MNDATVKKSKDLLVLSMDEAKLKRVANILANPTSKKILDHLSTKKSTEGDIAKALSLPISTVHYNVKQLEKAGLISAKEYHYSTKGREVNHYSLAYKHIIITPKPFDLKSELINILPTFLIVSATYLFYNLNRVKDNALYEDTAVSETAILAKGVAETISTSFNGLWIFAGIILGLIAYLATKYLRAVLRNSKD